MAVLKVLFSPIVFALGFLAPLVDQSLSAAGVNIAGTSNLAIGIGVALAIGVVAQIRGGWLWHTSKQ